MKNFLVPTDFSVASHHAFAAALQLAQRTGGHLTLLHTIELPETANFSSFGGPVGGSELPNSSGTNDLYMLQLLQATKRRMHALKDEAAQLAPGVPVQDVVHTGRLNPAVLALIEKQAIDLVVMGAQGHTATEHFFLGSNTERLVRTAPCPVLAVKQAPSELPVRTLVFPSDFSAEADRAVPELHRIQALFPEATLHLLHVVRRPEHRAAALDKITDFAHRHHLGRYEPTAFEADSPSEGIAAYATQNQVDLIVLPTHGRTGLSRFLQASIAEYVATHVLPPVLTFKLA